MKVREPAGGREPDAAVLEVFKDIIIASAWICWEKHNPEAWWWMVVTHGMKDQALDILEEEAHNNPDTLWHQVCEWLATADLDKSEWNMPTNSPLREKYKVVYGLAFEAHRSHMPALFWQHMLILGYGAFALDALEESAARDETDTAEAAQFLLDQFDTLPREVQEDIEESGPP